MLSLIWWFLYQKDVSRKLAFFIIKLDCILQTAFPYLNPLILKIGRNITCYCSYLTNEGSETQKFKCFPTVPQLGETEQDLKEWSSDSQAQDTFHSTSPCCSAPESHFPPKITQSWIKIPLYDYNHFSKSFAQIHEGANFTIHSNFIHLSLLVLH